MLAGRYDDFLMPELGLGAVEEMLEDLSKYRVQLLDVPRQEIISLIEKGNSTKNPDPELLEEIEKSLDIMFDVRPIK